MWVGVGSWHCLSLINVRDWEVSVNIPFHLIKISISSLVELWLKISELDSEKKLLLKLCISVWSVCTSSEICRLLEHDIGGDCDSCSGGWAGSWEDSASTWPVTAKSKKCPSDSRFLVSRYSTVNYWCIKLILTCPAIDTSLLVVIHVNRWVRRQVISLDSYYHAHLFGAGRAQALLLRYIVFYSLLN